MRPQRETCGAGTLARQFLPSEPRANRGIPRHPLTQESRPFFAQKSCSSGTFTIDPLASSAYFHNHFIEIVQPRFRPTAKDQRPRTQDEISAVWPRAESPTAEGRILE